MERKGRRRPWLAGLGNLLFPGLGFLYLGRVRLSVALPLAVLGLVAVAAWTRLILAPAGLALMLVLYLLLLLGGTVAAVVIARRAGVMALRPWQRGPVYLGFVALSIVINLSVSSFRGDLLGIEAYRMPSQAMAGTLNAGDQVLVDSWAYRGSSPQRGDVVMAVRRIGSRDARYVRRVVGLPGDVVTMLSDIVRVNGEELDEPYAITDWDIHPYTRRDGRYVVPEGHYFVLGDNRDHSRDSRDTRYWGYVAEEAIEGRVAFIFFSMDEEEDKVRSECIGQRVE